jgi:hypothetical protein
VGVQKIAIADHPHEGAVGIEHGEVADGEGLHEVRRVAHLRVAAYGRRLVRHQLS